VITWNLVYSKYAIKDAKKLSAAGLKDKSADITGNFRTRPSPKSTAL
jgi:hypothetical protein